jgi:hypothetical protein
MIEIMDFSLGRFVFCHDLINPPSQYRSSDIDLNLIHSVGFIDLKRIESESSESKYQVEVPSAMDLGFNTSLQMDLDNEFTNLVLAFNLVQKNICVTHRKAEFASYEVEPKLPRSKTRISKENEAYYVSSEDIVAFRDESHNTVHLSVHIEEQKIIEIFRKIQKLRRFERKSISHLPEINLIGALSLYESGMDEFLTLLKFKHLFNAFELVTNMTGTDWKGKDFDREAEKILLFSQAGLSVKINKATIKEWRELYNRIKHVQKNTEDIRKYYEGIDMLGRKLLSVRGSLNEIFLDKIK